MLTALGILLGWSCGMGLGYLVIRVLEVPIPHYVRAPSLKACIIAAAIGSFFAFVMNKIALQRIHRLNLADVNAN